MAKGKKNTSSKKEAGIGKKEAGGRKISASAHLSKILARQRPRKVATPLTREAIRQQIEAVLDHSRKGAHTPAHIGPILPIDEDVNPMPRVYSYNSDASGARDSEVTDNRDIDTVDLRNMGTEDKLDTDATDTLIFPPADDAVSKNSSDTLGIKSIEDAPRIATVREAVRLGKHEVELNIKSIEDVPRMATVREAAHGAMGIPFIPRLPSVFEASMGASAPAFISTLPGVYAEDYPHIPFRVNYRTLFEPAPPPIKVLPERTETSDADAGSNEAAGGNDDSLLPINAGEKTFVVNGSKRFEPAPSPLTVLDESRGEQTTLAKGGQTTLAENEQTSLAYERNEARRRMDEKSDDLPAPVIEDDSSSSVSSSSSSATSSDSMGSSWKLAAGLFGLLLVMMWFGGQFGAPPLASDTSASPLLQYYLSNNSSGLNNSAPLTSTSMLGAAYLRIGDEARMPDGSILKLESIHSTSSGLSARIHRIDSDGTSVVLELLGGQSAQWTGKDGAEYAVLAREDEAGSDGTGIRLEVLGAQGVGRPSQIRFSAPTYAYLLNGQYPVPVLLDNQTLQVGQSVQGGNLRAQLVEILSDANGRPSSRFRLLDGNGDEVGSTTLGGGQMVEMRTTQGERYTLLLRPSKEGGAASAQLYLNQAFDR